MVESVLNNLENKTNPCVYKVGVFDAGSTGTRLHIYSFQNDHLINFRYFDKEYSTSRGLQEMNEEEIKEEIESLVSMIEGNTENIPFGFYGTAGLRLLNDAKSSQILKVVAETLKNHKLVECKILSGDDEALYALKSFEFLNPSTDQFTLIDLGGKSVQIIIKNGRQIKIESRELGTSDRKHSIQLLNISSNLTSCSQTVDNCFCAIDKNIQSEIKQKDNNTLDSNYSITFESRKFEFEYASANYENVIVDNSFDSKKPKNLDFNNLCQEDSADLQLVKFMTKEEKLERFYINEFFSKKNIEKIQRSGSVFLVSAFDYIFPLEQSFTINELYDLLDRRRYEIFQGEHSEVYFCLKFLENIGIDTNLKLEVPNKKGKTPTSWVLGKAVYLLENFSNTNNYPFS